MRANVGYPGTNNTSNTLGRISIKLIREDDFVDGDQRYYLSSAQCLDRFKQKK